MQKEIESRSAEEVTNPTLPPKRSRKKFLKLGLIALAVITLGWIVYDMKFSKTEEEKAAEQVAAAVKAAGELMILPAGTPMLATVQDAAALKSQQPFFANAINGDELLMFAESRQAIIYSPSRNLIVNVGPIEYQAGAAAPQSQPTVVPSKATTTKPATKK